MNKALSLLKRLITDIILGALIGAAAILGLHMYNKATRPLTHIANTSDKHKLSPIVRLTTDEGRTFCTAVVVSSTTAITAAHCIIEGEFMGIMFVRHSISVRPPDASNVGVVAEVASASPQLDQATIRGDFSQFEPRAVQTDLNKLVEIVKNGTALVSCGYPLGGPLFCSKTIYVDRFNFMWKVKGLLLPGMSGGPPMLEDGTVVAINDAVSDDFSIVAPTYNTPIN